MQNQEKVIELINCMDELFDYFDIDDIIITEDYDNNLEIFSDRLNEIFKDGLNDQILYMISKLDKQEIFYIQQVEKFKNNKVRKQIVDYLDDVPLYFNYELVKNHIKENYKLAQYVKSDEKKLELLNLNQKVILLMDAKYLTEELILNEMNKGTLITEIFLGLHGFDSNIYKFSMFYKNSKDINDLLYEQSIYYFEKDIYRIINSSELVKCNKEISKFILNINPKLYPYVEGAES